MEAHLRRWPKGRIAHADWSVHPAKRWVAIAEGRTITSVEPVGELSSFFARLGPGAFVGFDFPIGLPRAYADAVGISAFRAWLAELGRGRWADFHRPATHAAEIGPYRPFYPQAPGGKRQAHLTAALGVPDMRSLLRACDRATAHRPAASCLFWTLGGNQVGKAALAGWRDLLLPALPGLLIWPFDGPLSEMFPYGNKIVVAETYPGEVYHHLGLQLRKAGGKRSQTARIQAAPHIEAWFKAHGIALAPAVATQLHVGFGAAADGEDRFDALIGLAGMLEVLLSDREPDVGPDPRVEGWVLGQRAGPPAREP